VNKKLFFVIILLCFVLSNCNKVDYYFIPDAKIKQNIQTDYGRNNDTSMLLTGHYIESGTNTVLIIRKYDKGSIFSVDDEIFQKLTIQLDEFEIGTPISASTSGLLINYSKGVSGQIRRGDGRYSTSTRGSLTVMKQVENKMEVKIDLQFEVIPTEAFSILGPINENINGYYVFKKIKIDDLTPWLGTPGETPGKEVYPP